MLFYLILFYFIYFALINRFTQEVNLVAVAKWVETNKFVEKARSILNLKGGTINVLSDTLEALAQGFFIYYCYFVIVIYLLFMNILLCVRNLKYFIG